MAVSRGRRLPPSLSERAASSSGPLGYSPGVSPEPQTPAFVERDQRGRGAILQEARCRGES